MNWLELVLLILASFRLTHLVVFDSITEPVRQRLLPVPFLGDLVSCYWCAGIWVSVLLGLAHFLAPVPTRYVTIVLAVAAGQAILETLIQRE